MNSSHVPFVVLGAGSAGLVVAVGLAKAGKKVLLLEDGNYGGDCTNFGCIPSKSLIKSAEIGHAIRSSSDFGIELSLHDFQADGALKRVQKIVSNVRSHEDSEALSSHGIETLTGRASFTSPQSLEVILSDGGIHTLSFSKCIIATGSKPKIPDIEGLDTISYLTNETLFSLEKIPAKLAILGSGPIGCEMGQAFSRLGSSVQIIGTHEVLMPQEDTDVQEVIYNRFSKESIELYLGYDAFKVSREGNTIAIFLRHKKDGTEKQLTATHLLVAIGRKPHCTGLNLEKAQVSYDERGIQTDSYGKTSQKYIWAIGDAVGAPFFTHWAEHQARVVLFNLLVPFPFRKKMQKKEGIAHTTFTDPEVARIGPSYEALVKRYGEKSLSVQKVSFSEIDRAITQDETDGFVKIITKKWSSTIVGATIVGSRAGEMLCQVATCMGANIGLRKLSSVIHPYPTYSLALRKASDMWLTATLLANLKTLPRTFLKRTWPLLLLLFIGAVVYATGVTEYLDFDTLRAQRNALKAFVEEYPLLAPVCYILVYILVTALEVPAAVFLSLTGGFLFPQPWCTLYTVIGATVGATCIFAVAKTVFADHLRERAGPFLKKMEIGFQENAVNYLLFLRLVPIFPFWLINIAPAFFGIRLRTFVLTTFFGIIPGAFVFTQAGRGIDSILRQKEVVTAGDILTPDIIIALCGLGILALIPVVIRYFQRRKKLHM